jgi:hypothetical protein
VRIAYLTTDVVNQDWATRLADCAGTTLENLWPKEAAPDGRFEAVLYDWDSLPPDHQQEILAVLLSCPPPRPVALHSYNLGEPEAKAIRQRGVAIFRRLELRIFMVLKLAQVVRSGHADGGARRTGTA